MFVEERKEQILEMVRKFGKVKVKELSKQFEVTEDYSQRFGIIRKKKFIKTRLWWCG